MKVGIVGSRRYENKKKIKDFIFKLKQEYGEDTIVITNSILYTPGGSEIEVILGNINSGDFLYSDINGGQGAVQTSDGASLTAYANNIDEDPNFTNPDDGNYSLQWPSPCINSGDPNSPFDPDGTIADMGAYYFDFSDYGCTDQSACN